jgi:hypothetical protein
MDHRGTWDMRKPTETMPVKESHTRIKPLALASVNAQVNLVRLRSNTVNDKGVKTKDLDRGK